MNLWVGFLREAGGEELPGEALLEFEKKCVYVAGKKNYYL